MTFFQNMDLHCYIISYDLCKPGRDYSSLYRVIKSFPGWGKLTESTWAVVAPWSAVQIRDYLMQYMDANDRLVVILSGRVAAWTKLLASNDWLRNNLAK